MTVKSQSSIANVVLSPILCWIEVLHCVLGARFEYRLLHSWASPIGIFTRRPRTEDFIDSTSIKLSEVDQPIITHAFLLGLLRWAEDVDWTGWDSPAKSTSSWNWFCCCWNLNFINMKWWYSRYFHHFYWIACRLFFLAWWKPIEFDWSITTRLYTSLMVYRVAITYWFILILLLNWRPFSRAIEQLNCLANLNLLSCKLSLNRPSYLNYGYPLRRLKRFQFRTLIGQLNLRFTVINNSIEPI